MSCLRNAGRQPSYRGMTMYTTLSPCPMCTGAILLFQIPRVVVGEATTFAGDLDFLASHGVDVLLLDDRALQSRYAGISGTLSAGLERGHRRAVAHRRKLTAVVFAPLITTATVSPGRARPRRTARAARAAHPPGSATSRSGSQSSAGPGRWRRRRPAHLRRVLARMAKVSSPTCRGASESTATLPAGASTGGRPHRGGEGRRALRFGPHDPGPAARSRRPPRRAARRRPRWPARGWRPGPGRRVRSPGCPPPSMVSA